MSSVLRVVGIRKWLETLVTGGGYDHTSTRTFQSIIAGAETDSSAADSE